LSQRFRSIDNIEIDYLINTFSNMRPQMMCVSFIYTM